MTERFPLRYSSQQVKDGICRLEGKTLIRSHMPIEDINRELARPDGIIEFNRSGTWYEVVDAVATPLGYEPRVA